MKPVASTLSARMIAALSIGILVSTPISLSAQSYPNKPIRILANEPGGGNDLTARIIAQGITGPLGQPVIIENRPSLIATETAARAQPDGYTLLTAGNSLWLLQFLRDRVAWDPIKSFSPITMISTAPLILVVSPALPAKSVKELIALANAKPGELNLAASARGTPVHLAAEFFNIMAGVKITSIQYKSTAASLAGLMGGEVQLTFSPATAVNPLLKSGKIRGMAVTSAQPSALAPGLPTVAASGVPGYEMTQLVGMFAPGKPPAAIVHRLNQEIVRVLNQPDVKEKVFISGADVIADSPEHVLATMKSQMATMGKMIRDAGIRAD